MTTTEPSASIDEKNMEEIPIPGPMGLPIVGNVTEFSSGEPVTNVLRLADTYGMRNKNDTQKKKQGC